VLKIARQTCTALDACGKIRASANAKGPPVVLSGIMATHPIRIIGIDPGLRRTGWGIIVAEGARLSYVASGLITSDSEDELAYRLCALHAGLVDVIGRFAPEEAAVEETFVNKDARATLKLGQARGMALLAPAQRGLRVAEYPPNVIKKTITGTGHGEKRQIAAMVGFLLPRAKFESADEADALAIAVCHASHRASLRLSQTPLGQRAPELSP
jgi:crossover junction endodeoxyribonuclease RuvC